MWTVRPALLGPLARRVLLGIDLGTSSVKALLLDRSGVVVGRGAAPHPVRSPFPGWAETDPPDWWVAVVAAVREAVGERGREVRALGLSGQMHGLVLCDRAGAPVRPAILWADTRTRVEVERARALPESLRLRLANPLAVGMAGLSLCWVRDHEPEAYRTARWALQPKDWLRLRLTGVAASEPTDASATLLYEVPADRWSGEAVVAFGLRRELLAPLVGSAEVAGELRGAVADALGLRAGTPVAAGAGDTAAGLVGAGLEEPGAVQLTLGTGGQLVSPVGPERRANPTLRTHLYRAAGPPGWYRMAAVQNVGLALAWVRGVLGVSWPQFYEEAFSVPVGAERARFLPYLSGERTPLLDPDARGSWQGLGLIHGRAHLLRAALDGVACALRDAWLALADLGVAPEAIRLAGGGSLDPRWRQVIADVLERPLLAVEVADVSALGAALLAGRACGIGADAATIAPAPQLVAEPSGAAHHYEDIRRDLSTRYRLLRRAPEVT